MNIIRKLVNEEEGQALTEYGLILGLIAVVCVGTMAVMGGNVNSLLTKISTSLGGAAVP